MLNSTEEMEYAQTDAATPQFMSEAVSTACGEASEPHEGNREADLHEGEQANAAVQSMTVSDLEAPDRQMPPGMAQWPADVQLGKVTEKLEASDVDRADKCMLYHSSSTACASEEKQESFSGISSTPVCPSSLPNVEEESAQSYARLIAQALAEIMSDHFIHTVQKQLFERFAESEACAKLIESVAERTVSSCAEMMREVAPRPGSPCRSGSPGSPCRSGSPWCSMSSPTSPREEIEFQPQSSSSSKTKRQMRAERSFMFSDSNNSSCNSRNSSTLSKRPMTDHSSINESLADAKEIKCRGAGVRQIEESIGNRLLESMDLCPSPSLKVNAMLNRRNSSGSLPRASSLTFTRLVSPSKENGSPQARTSMRSSIAGFFRRGSKRSTINSRGSGFVLSEHSDTEAFPEFEKHLQGLDGGHMANSDPSQRPNLQFLRPAPQGSGTDLLSPAGVEAQESSLPAKRHSFSFHNFISPSASTAEPSGVGNWASLTPSSQRMSQASVRLHVTPISTGLDSSSRFSSLDNMAKLRRLRTNELVQDMRGSVEMDGLEVDNSHTLTGEYESEEMLNGVKPIYYLRLWGILGWRSVDTDDLSRLWSWSVLYQWIVFLVTLTGLGVCITTVLNSRTEEEKLCYSDACLRLGLFTDIPLFVGSAFGLAALGTYSGRKNLSECIGILINYSHRQGFLQPWERLMWRDLVVVFLIWVVAVLERFRGTGTLRAAQDGTLTAWGMLHMILFATSTGVLLGLTFCILCFCRGFTTMVDSFCASVAAKGNLDNAVASWNILQAVLRKSSAVIECCFFVLQTTAFSTILIGVADVVHSLASQDHDLLITLIPCVLVTFGVATIFFSAAKVTEKCAHVPSLVNSMSFGVEIDHERQYVVEYIIHSAAGFYVFEVRLTSAMSLKFAYFCIVAAFTMTTWLSTQIH